MWCDWQTLRNCCAEDPSAVMNTILEAKVPLSWVVFPFLLSSELKFLTWLYRPLSMYQCPHIFSNYMTSFFLFHVYEIYQHTEMYSIENRVDAFVILPFYSCMRFHVLYTLGAEYMT